MSAAQIALEALQRIRDDLYGFLLSDDFDAETIVKASETLLPNLHDVALAATKSLEAEIAQELEPVDCQFQGADGRWHSFINDQHKADTIASGKFLIRELFTAPQPTVNAELLQALKQLLASAGEDINTATDTDLADALEDPDADDELKAQIRAFQHARAAIAKAVKS